MADIQTIDISDFVKVDIRVGRIVQVDAFPEARKPAYRLTIDCGEDVGEKQSSARITERYRPDELHGRLVAVVVNLPPRQIGPMMSEVLVLGFPDADGRVVLVGPDADVPLGGKLY